MGSVQGMGGQGVKVAGRMPEQTTTSREEWEKVWARGAKRRTISKG